MVFQHSTGSCRWQFIYPLLPAARTNRHFNPGQGWVSRLCHEPRVALAVIEELLAHYRAN
jgi:hypothetical protein